MGYPDGAPYDAIHVGAAAPEVGGHGRTDVTHRAHIDVTRDWKRQRCRRKRCCRPVRGFCDVLRAQVPEALTQQLAPGGRLVVPVGPEGGSQHLVVVDKAPDGRLVRKDVMGVM